MRKHCLKLAAQFGVMPREASQIIDEVNGAVARWSEFADQARCTSKVARTIGAAIATL